MKRIVTYGKYQLAYNLIHEKRKSLRLTVWPDASVEVHAPHKVGLEEVESFIQQKWLWLQRQLRDFGKYRKQTIKREYVSGESYLYLGRQYMLKVQKAKVDRVKLQKGVFILETTHKIRDKKHNEKLLKDWFEKRRKAVFDQVFQSSLKEFNYNTHPDLQIRSMSKRWGSYVKHKKVILNPDLISAPKECIRYVIIHELCHFKYKNHDKNFYRLLEQKFPGWEKSKEKLELMIG